jgi:hypothetical protein
MKRLNFFPKKSSHRGQSLVEVALFFPIFIMMLAGLVEVANILITQNRVTSATRSSTRFAANGGEDAGMPDVLLNTVTQTLRLEENLWDVWAVRGRVNSAGDAIIEDSWSFNHIYGISATGSFTEVDEIELQDEVLDQLQRDEFGNERNDIAENVEFVATYAIHDVDSILGLNAIPYLADFTSVKELTVMRLTSVSTSATNGCLAFPIGIQEGLRSVGPGSSPYPNPGDFANPGPHPAYQDFVHHVPNAPLLDANEGYVFRIYYGSGSGNFAWLLWNTGLTAGAVNADNMLAWPGNSGDYTTGHGASGSAMPGYGGPVFGFFEAGDATDVTMHVNDFVADNPGVGNDAGVTAVLNGHIASERTLRFIIWDTTGTGSYLISRFAAFKLHGYNLQQGWILAEFIRWDDSCGQVPGTP